jgi:hypothetical protein
MGSGEWGVGVTFFRNKKEMRKKIVFMRIIL